MRTDGLVWAVALSLFFVAYVRAADQAANPSSIDSSSTGAATPVASEIYDVSNCSGGATYYYSSAQEAFWYAGSQLTFLHVNFHSGATVTSILDDQTTPGTEFSFSTTDELQNWGYAPRAWLGAHLNEDWSIEGRFWSLQDSAASSKPGDIVAPAFANRFYTNPSIETYTVDLDVIRTFRLNGWQIDAQLGARYGSFSSETAVGGLAFDPNYINSLDSDITAFFNGTGFSYGGTFSHALGNTNLFWVTSARGTYISGRETLRGFANSASSPAPGGVIGVPFGTGATLVIAELQTGIEWDYALRTIPANAFVRVSYEFQNWHVSGPVEERSTLGFNANYSNNLIASGGLGEMILNGVGLTVGLGW